MMIKMLSNEIKILKEIGKNPHLDKGELAERLDTTENTIGSIIGKQRSHTRVVKAPPYDKEKGFEWFLTGKGKRFVEEKLDELEEELGESIDRPELVAFKPRHAR